MRTPKKFSSKTLETMRAVNQIIIRLKKIGKPTLMQIYVWLVTDEEIEDSRQSYKRLQDIVSEGRKCGIFGKDDIAGRYRGIDDETFSRL